MIKPSITLRYAKALFDLDVSKGNFSNRAKDFRQIINLFEKQPKILKLLYSPQLTQSEKEALLKSSLKVSDKLFLNFIFYLVKKNRLNFLKEISSEYENMVDQHEGLWQVELVTKIPIEPLLKEELVKKLEKFYNKKIIFKEVIDHQILGGVLLYVGNKVIDWTIKTRMNKLKEKLLAWNI